MKNLFNNAIIICYIHINYFNYIFFYTIIDNEMGMCSIYEFIYSFRESINSPFPDIQSQQTIDSLNMMKNIKNTISSSNYIIETIFFHINFIIILLRRN